MKYLYAITFYFLSCSTFALTTSTYFHNDPLGSPSEQTNHLGDTLWPSPVYKPYGERESFPSIGNTSSIGYTGKIDDADTGLTYMNARYYDPRIGRFLSPDPMTFIDGGPAFFSRYTYAHNNPYAYIDPTGAIPLPVMIGLGALAVMGNNAHYLSGQIPQRQSLKARMRENLEALPATVLTTLVGRFAPGTTTILDRFGGSQLITTHIKKFGDRLDLDVYMQSVLSKGSFTVLNAPKGMDANLFQRTLGAQLHKTGHQGDVRLINSEIFGITRNGNDYMVDKDLLNRAHEVGKRFGFKTIEAKEIDGTGMNLFFNK